MQRYLTSRNSSMPYLNTKQDRCRFPHRAERRDLGRDDGLVDADDTVFEGLRDAPDTAYVGRRRRRSVVGASGRVTDVDDPDRILEDPIEDLVSIAHQRPYADAWPLN